MEINDIGVLTLEAAGSMALITICYKIWKMKISTKSGCCGDMIHIETENPGGEGPMSLVGTRQQPV